MTQAQDEAASQLERGDAASEAPPSYHPRTSQKVAPRQRSRWEDNSHQCFVITAIVCIVLVIGLAVGLAVGIKRH